MTRFTWTGTSLLVASIFVFGLGVAGARAEEAVTWLDDYHVAKAAAIEAGKKLLVVLEDPSQASHTVQQVSDSSGAVEAELLKPFVLCRVDVTSEKGKSLAEAFGATEYPFTAVIDRRGRFVDYKHSGEFSNTAWVAMLVEQGQEEQRVETASRSRGICFT
ncbi:MAG: thioredoxin family protein [Planctomycetota bacterium]|nr:MAG: thioredoxin family protein [Planctomycetota bacterium]REK47191.1 MAG: thioredoxin family protein [Planctomycetota bacterium]